MQHTNRQDIDMAIGTLPPELFAEQQQLNRQQQLAQLLMQQGQQMPQSQMVSGRYVAPSIFQNIAPLVQTYMGQKMAEKGDKKAVELAAALRKQQQEMGENYFNAISPQQTELAGPTPTGAPLTTVNQADYRKAFGIASDPYAPSWLKAQAAEMLKPQKVAEGEKVIRFNPATGKNEVVAEGGEKFKAPIQVDTGTTIEFRDPRNPTVVLQTIPKTQMPTAGQVVERDDGTFLVDTRTGQSRPVMGQGGQPLTGGGKPLTEAQGNSVAFGARAIEANRIVTELEKAGTTNTGIIRGAIGGTVGMAPFVGEKMQQSVQSAMNVLPGFAGGPNQMQQQTDQGRRNFISAVLRKESGAAIPTDEYANEEKKYFPQVGDGPKVIQQKQKARELAIEALKAQAGPSGVRQINQITSQFQGGNTGGVVDFNSLPQR
jgi:hypothetical protein